jgi:hypothetical protein
MRNTTELTPPGWNDDASFRETMLCYLPPEDAEKLRQAGAVIYSMAESIAFEEAGESSTLIELRAVHADLTYLQGYLAEISLEPEHSELEPEDSALAAFAGEMAARVAALANALAERLATSGCDGAALGKPLAEQP